MERYRLESSLLRGKTEQSFIFKRWFKEGKRTHYPNVVALMHKSWQVRKFPRDANPV
jgi:hypothetical protein